MSFLCIKLSEIRQLSPTNYSLQESLVPYGKIIQIGRVTAILKSLSRNETSLNIVQIYQIQEISKIFLSIFQNEIIIIVKFVNSLCLR